MTEELSYRKQMSF